MVDSPPPESPGEGPTGSSEVPEWGAGLGGPDARRLTDAVTRLRRSLRTSLRSELSSEALPMAQIEILATLAEHSPVRVSELADGLKLASSTVSGLLTQMMNADLVLRDTDRRDRRAAVVTLTGEGRRRLAEWEQAHERRLSSAMARLPPAERQALDRVVGPLGQLAALLDEDTENADHPSLAPSEPVSTTAPGRLGGGSSQ